MNLDTGAARPARSPKLLEDKVVVLSGVGPGLGRALGEEAARMGADLVLVSRTERRLQKMAEVVRSHGRRALVVPTDITDEDQRAALVRAALDEFGRVDCLINNAFGIPPMDPLTTLDLDGLRAANETNVFAPLRLSALFADALAESQGSVIMLNSCVMYSSQPEYAGYKLSKGALAHLSSSLATELGPRGIRVNSVAPSYIYEDVNKAYFDWLASEQGVTHEEIYRQKAQPTDLKRLATPDEVARATLFLASDLASAVTGQVLTVDCGEFHSR
ncbi:NAD(P)-dependent dehydrogenase (short-subunit alcohol dehydrogenase family) [Nocardioides ginsengisegetis]|uniref:NAD(P)-dependent dehydrogenase (Short-subunit alcohol dehydrogenase family) n=1 Tax=Nocardioides ginsengisegetis TaxID=661491 RepID=A0A7W3PBQ2_9ACTN|nr:NAD(P)-dependent dehydrogenase (short-subunit alcohol dehydrogenase family) [Nocardioides ginsengisegetis]